MSESKQRHTLKTMNELARELGLARSNVTAAQSVMARFPDWHESAIAREAAARVAYDRAFVEWQSEGFPND